MIFKRRLNATLLLLLCSTFVACTERSGDFKFGSDDLQVNKLCALKKNLNFVESGQLKINEPKRKQI